VKVFLEFYLLLEGWHRRIFYKSGELALQKLGRKIERWATQLSRTPSKAGARDAEQHSTPSGSSLFTLAKLELPWPSPTSASGYLVRLCVKSKLYNNSSL
jgi:hypothetical protein